MRLLAKGFASILAVALAGSLSVSGVHAVAKLDRPSVTSTVEQVAAKKATKKVAKKAVKKKAAKKGKKSAWKSCGAGKYHDKKTGKCSDASAKK